MVALVVVPLYSTFKWSHCSASNLLFSYRKFYNFRRRYLCDFSGQHPDM